MFFGSIKDDPNFRFRRNRHKAQKGMDIKMSKVLIIAPHPDDEVLGCGAVIARHVADGDRVSVCIVSNHDEPVFTAEHREITKAEARKAHAILGVSETIFLDFAAVTLKDLPVYTLNGAVLKAVKSVSPDIVYMPHLGDMHIDHRLVAEASLVAIRPLAGNTVKKAYAYETLSETEWNLPRAEYAFMPNVFVNVSDFIQKKLDAMSCFESQLFKAPHPRSIDAIKNLAKVRGGTISVPFAEAFMLIRELI